MTKIHDIKTSKDPTQSLDNNFGIRNFDYGSHVCHFLGAASWRKPTGLLVLLRAEELANRLQGRLSGCRAH